MKHLLLLVLLGTVLSQNEVDTVEQLLAELKGASQAELTNLNIDYEQSTNLKQDIIFNLGKALQEQTFLCQSRDKSVSDRVSDIEKTNNYITWLQKRLVDNANRISTLEANRCLHGSNYIERVKNDNLTLRMIIFLRTSLQNLDGAKLNRMGSYVQKFLHIYKNAKLSELIQLATEFKDTMQVDWEEAPLPKGGNLETYKSELIEMLNEMERYIRAQMKNNQDLEIRTGVSWADFKGAIQIEDQQLEFDQNAEKKNLITLGDQLVLAQKAAVDCQSRRVQLQDSINKENEDMARSTNIYNKNKARLTEELNLFNDVYRIYSTQVGTSDDRFKQRVSDVVNNKEMSEYKRDDYQLSDAVKEQVQNE